MLSFYAQMTAFAKLFRSEELKGPRNFEYMPEETRDGMARTVLLQQDVVVKLVLQTSVAELTGTLIRLKAVLN